jgi:hypothetical protein
MVPELSARILVMVKVQLKKDRETTTTELTSIPKPGIEDAHLEILISCNAESMVDQTTMTRAHKLTSDAQENHGNQPLARRVVNSISPVLQMDGYTEKEKITDGDH